MKKLAEESVKRIKAREIPAGADQGFARRFVYKLMWAIVGAGLLGITAGAVRL